MTNITTTGQKVVKVLPNVKFLSTLRNSGYNNYNALTDIIDNSLDNDVNAKNIKIEVSFGKKNSISIIDDGVGMTEKTLIEAFKLGSITDKDPAFDLGCYGTGLKSAGLSMGRCITILTKHENDDYRKAIYDYDHMLNVKDFDLTIDTLTVEEIKYFKSAVKSKTNKNGTGTIVVISNLDRITNTNITIFSDLLAKEIGLTFKFFIDELGINITVNNEKITSIDPMMRNSELSNRMNGDDNNIILYNGKKYKFNCYNIETTTVLESNIIGRNSHNSGFYIYRNNRLVGRALDLGILNKYSDGYLNGFRIELFIDGDDDKLFTSTFSKIITEKDAKSLDQGFKDKLLDAVKPYRITSYNSNKKGDKKTPPNHIKDMDKVFEDINSNKLIHRKVKKDVNMVVHEDDVTIPIDNDKEKRKYPSGTKKIKSIKSYDWKTVNYGEAGVVSDFIYENGKIIILWNADHKFWKEYMINATAKDKLMITKIFIAQARALEKLPDEFRIDWDQFNSDTGVELNRVMAQ